jgi:hypothetical protein
LTVRRGDAPRALRVRLLGFVATCVLVVAGMEAASFVLFWVATGRRFSYRRIAQEQADGARAWQPPPPPRGGPGPTMPPAPEGQVVEARPDRTPQETIPHPFIGFTYNPENAVLLAAQGKGAFPLTEHGFFDLPNPPAGEDVVSVAVFGGSVAAFFAVDAREALTRVLMADPRLRGKRLQVHSVALGGFKQPQMLGALAYLMALGQRYDVVVELDGFNEVALSFLEYKHKGLFPGYPRDWDGLIGPTPNIQKLRGIGRVAYWQQWRGAAAARFGRPPLSWSVTGALVWKCLDRLCSARVAQASEEMERMKTSDRYRETGPHRDYGSEREVLEDIARIWALSSLQMERLCAGAGTQYFHFLQPNQYDAGSKKMGEAEKAVAYRSGHPYRAPIEAGYPLMRAEGARLRGRGVQFHDLSQIYAGVAEPLYIDDCCHLNAKGNALLGEAVGRIILKDWKP